MIRRFSILIFILVLGLSLAGINNGFTYADDSEAEWAFNSKECSMGVSGHDDLDMTDLNIIPDNYIYFSNDYNANKRTVSTESSCPYTFSVHVSETGAPSDDINVLEHFDIKATTDSENTSGVISGYNNLEGHASEGNSLKIGNVDGSDWSGNLNNINGTDWVIDYRYLMDPGDETGTYTVELTYTVSAQD